MAQYVNSSLFHNSNHTCKFILEAPIGPGKSTALMKQVNDNKESNNITVVPTANIATDFYNLFIKTENDIKL